MILPFPFIHLVELQIPSPYTCKPKVTRNGLYEAPLSLVHGTGRVTRQMCSWSMTVH